MPDYEVTDPQRKLTLTVTGPTPPSQAMLDALFHDAAMKTAHMGPVPEDAPVTLADLIDNPSGAVRRMVTITKNAISDPRVMIPAAIGLGAGALRMVGVGSGSMPQAAGEVAAEAAPAASGGPSRMGAVIQAVKQNPEAAIDALPLGRTVKGIAKLASAARDIHRAANAPEAPVSTPPATPNTAPSPAAAPVPPRAPAAATPSASEGLPSLEDLHLTPAEITTAVKWHESGVSPETILHRILQSRQLTARTNATTPDQAAEAVRRRNATGKWD